MKEDPYVAMLSMMKTPAASSTACGMIGTVTSADPLKITVSGLELDKDDLLINEMLLPSYARTMSFSSSAGMATWTNKGLKAGDKVLLVPTADMQQYFVVCTLKAVT